jgi:valyl-tRNA synthetase
LRDWNISRQIAWGIPIPAFQNIDNPDDWIYDESVDQEIIEKDGKTYRRDPDVFDTWFSSSSWPYATLDYPSDLSKQFYPNSLMETGGEILYPWVSRMIMLGLYVTGDIPFKDVYIHGYVLAEDGAKMSKSVGNVIDPMAAIDQYGTDALRLGLLAGRAPAVNRGYDTRRVEEARNFCNKLWNVARFIEDKLGDDFSYSQHATPETAADHWMLQKLQQSTEEITSYLENYRLSEAYELLYHLVWDDLADWYIEASKTALNKNILAYSLETILKLLHPFAPFVTETICQTLSWEPDSMLATRPWPKPPKADSKRAGEFAEIQAIVAEARQIIKTVGASQITLYYTDVPFLADNAELIQHLAKLHAVTEVKEGDGLFLTNTNHRCWLDIDSGTARHYASELQAKHTEQQKLIAGLEARLANKAYVQQAPKHIVTQTKDQLSEAQTQLAKLADEIKRFAA